MILEMIKFESSQLENCTKEGDSPVNLSLNHFHLHFFLESGCLGSQPKMGGKFHLKLNIRRETDSEIK